MNALRIRHLENCLTQYDRISRLSLPLDKFLAQYFSAHRTIKPVDKHFISQQAEDVLRWRGLLDAVSVAPLTWASRLKTYYCSTRWKMNTRNKHLEAHTRCSFPPELFLKLQESLGEMQAFPTCLVLNEAAPRHLRVNVARISRDNLYRALTYKGLGVEKSPEVPTGLHLVSSHKLLDLAEYRDGYFEMQDVASQMIAHSIACSPGEIVLDYCAGTGGKRHRVTASVSPSFEHLLHLCVAGKASVFGVFLENKGRLILHDIRADVLRRAKQRVARADIRPVHVALGDENGKTLEPFLGRCHWVICDVPCTSTGSLRRNPHLKWHYSDSWVRKVAIVHSGGSSAATSRNFKVDCALKSPQLEELVALQRRIVKTAVKYMRPKEGKLVYITRSLLKEENFDQVKYFKKELKLCPAETPEFSLPRSLGHDGFFSCVLELMPSDSPPSSTATRSKGDSKKTSSSAKNAPPSPMAKNGKIHAALLMQSVPSSSKPVNRKTAGVSPLELEQARRYEGVSLAEPKQARRHEGGSLAEPEQARRHEGVSLAEPEQARRYDVVSSQLVTRPPVSASMKPEASGKLESASCKKSTPENAEDLFDLDAIDVTFVKNHVTKHAVAPRSFEACEVKTQDACGHDGLPSL